MTSDTLSCQVSATVPGSDNRHEASTVKYIATNNLSALSGSPPTKKCQSPMPHLPACLPACQSKQTDRQCQCLCTCHIKPLVIVANVLALVNMLVFNKSCHCKLHNPEMEVATLCRTKRHAHGGHSSAKACRLSFKKSLRACSPGQWTNGGEAAAAPHVDVRAEPDSQALQILPIRQLR